MKPERIHYLDWLKVLIVYGIVLFHVSLVFAYGGWLVTNPTRSVVLSAFSGFCFPWGIPAMFLIAGADAWFGLRSHSAWEFVKGRVQRLVIPLVAGVIVLGPLQRYLASHTPPPPLDRLPGYYVDFFQNLRFGLNLGWVGTYWMHLWFLAYLFAISTICAPLIVWLRSPSGRAFGARVVRTANRRGGMYVLALPLLVSQLALRPFFHDYQGWADFATYTFVFIAGALLFSSRDFEPAIRRDIRLFVTTGVIALPGLGLLLALSAGLSTTSPLAKVGLLAYSFMWALDIWSWLLAVLYLGIRWLDFSNRFLSYASDSVLPIYVIHHPVVILIASFVVTTSLGVWPKFVLILVGAFALTLGVYELCVRRWTAARLAFGLKPAPRGVRAPIAADQRGRTRPIAAARR